MLGRMHRFHVVDAFTDQPFRGNPAAVLVLDGPYDDAWAQRVAAEFNLSETAFVRPVTADGADYELRWFTPRTEVDLCGHATLAAAHVLVEHGAGGPFRFTSRSGVLTVTVRDGMLWLDFPANPPYAKEVPDGLLAALGGEPVWAGFSDVGDYFVVYPDEAAVRALVPDLAAVERCTVRGVTVTAPADAAQSHDFVSRLFAPAVGVPEDPVTGSAHTALGPYWAGRLGRTRLEAVQCSARGGDLTVELPADAPDRVHIGGRAVTVSEGTLHA